MRRAVAAALVAWLVPGQLRAQGQSIPDSTAAQIEARCPSVKDSLAAWRHVEGRWVDDTAHPTWANDSLRRVLLAMSDTDQAVRTETNEPDSVMGRRMMAVDAANDRRLNAILARYGWPTRSLVGRQGAFAAWLIAQHADNDTTGLQRRALAMMRAAGPREVSPNNLGYLTDRVRVRAHQPQLYGTQFEPLADGRLVLSPVADEAHVEERRAKAGIEPLGEYLCVMSVSAHTEVLRHAPGQP